MSAFKQTPITKKKESLILFCKDCGHWRFFFCTTETAIMYCQLLFFQPTLEKAQLHALHGDQLIQSNHYAVDSIRPKCVELRRICDDFSNEAKKKTDVLSKSLEIHMGIKKVKTRSDFYTPVTPRNKFIPCTWINCH